MYSVRKMGLATMMGSLAFAQEGAISVEQRQGGQKRLQIPIFQLPTASTSSVPVAGRFIIR